MPDDVEASDVVPNDVVPNDVVPNDVVVVWHDVLPDTFPIRATLRRISRFRLRDIDQGTRLKPMLNETLLRHIEADEADRREGARILIARYAQIVTGGPGLQHVRSIAPVSHAVLRQLRKAERTVTGSRPAASVADDEEGAARVAAGIVELLGAARPSYPFASPQAGFYLASGRAKPGGAPVRANQVALVAARLGAPVMPVLADFPALATLSLRRALRQAGVALQAPARPGAEAQSGGAQGGAKAGTPVGALADALLAWRRRLPASVFERLCTLNQADLLLLDLVATSHAERMGFGPKQRAFAEEALGRAAEVTGHRRAAPPRRRPGAPGAHAAPAAPAAPADPAAPAVPTRMVRTIEPDALLGWRNRPHASFAMTILGRRIVHATDAHGNRVVPGQQRTGERRLSIYGCSNAFGWGVLAEESFAAVLQARHPTWRVENFGVNGYGSVHAVLALERDMAAARPDYVTFSWSAEHLLRNVADIAFILSRTPRHGAEGKVLKLSTPRASLREDGGLDFRDVAWPRADLLPLDLTEFGSDPYYLDLVGFKLIERAARAVGEAGGHFFLTVLRSAPSPALSRRLQQAGIPVVTVMLPSASFTNLPDDSHPNAAGHALFADAIEAHLQAHAHAHASANAAPIAPAA